MARSVKEAVRTRYFTEAVTLTSDKQKGLTALFAILKLRFTHNLCANIFLNKILTGGLMLGLGLFIGLNSIYKTGESVVPLQFTQQPQSKTVDEYALAAFSCEVSGGVAPYSYQYKKNGVNVGANSAALSFTTAATDNGASITVTVTDSANAVITSTAAVLGVISYRYLLDGVTQYNTMSSPITMAANDYVEFKFVYTGLQTPTNNRYVLDGDHVNRAYFYINQSGQLLYNSSFTRVFIDGIEVSRGVTLIPNDGLVHTFKVVYLVASNITTLGIRYTFTEPFKGYLYSMVVTRAAGAISIPLNNKPQGATQLATVGSVNATIVNYNAAGWVAI